MHEPRTRDPRVTGLTEAGESALRVLHASTRPMMAWEIGLKGFRHISACTYRDERRNPRTMAAASAARKLAADGWAARFTLKTYGLTPEQRAYIDRTFPEWGGEAAAAGPGRQGRAVELE